jgi:hypothetical protein
LSTTDPEWTDLGANLGLCNEMPSTNHLSYGTADITSCYNPASSSEAIFLKKGRLVKNYNEFSGYVRGSTHRYIHKLLFLCSNKILGFNVLLSFHELSFIFCHHIHKYLKMIIKQLAFEEIKSRVSLGNPC